MTTSIYIAKTVYGGDGLGRLGDGRVVFVPGAFGGEHVRAEIVEEKKNFVRARLASVEDASPFRTGDGPMPQPGMVYANLSARGECETKASQLEEALSRARISVPEGAFAARPAAGGDEADMLNYRNKVVYHIGRAGKKYAIGYRAEPSHEIADVENDVLARPEINAKLPEIRRNVQLMLSQGVKSARRTIEERGDVTVRWTRRSGVQWWIGEAPEGTVLRESACGKPFDVPAGGFWQVNTMVGEALARAVAAEYAAAGAPGLVDLYCGVGVLGLVCGAKRLEGVESGRQAAEFARRNAAALGAKDAVFHAGRAEDCLKRLDPAPGSVAIVDPPRGGMEPRVVQWLVRTAAISRVICVSCDPATLVRDLRTLSAAFRVESVKWFNMFPRTARFETLAVLARR